MKFFSRVVTEAMSWWKAAGLRKSICDESME